MPTAPANADRPWAEGVDYADITLTILSLSDDGEEVVVEDRHGHRATLSTSDFHQDEKDALDPGDTVLCHVLAEALASSGGTLEPDAPTEKACHNCVHGEEEGDVDNLPPACRDCWGVEGKPGFQAREAVRVTVTELPPQENPEDADETPGSENGAESEDERVLLLASSGSTWTVHQNEDLKFRLQIEDGEAEEDDEEPTRPGSASVHFVRTETITAHIGLSPREMEDIGDRMAKTVSHIEELKDELDSTRKRINERIKALQQELKDASGDWESGSVTRQVLCDMCADYDAGVIVWRDHDTGVEIKRRPMTSEERQLPLPIVYPDAADVSGMADPTPASSTLSASDGHGCFDCSRALPSLKDEEEIPVPCRTCARTGNGEEDSWRPARKCLTCAHAMFRVDMPPCAGCERNADDAHRGGEDNWVWKDAPESGEPTAADEAWGRADAQGGPEAGQEAEQEGFFDPATGEILVPMPGTPVADEPLAESPIQ